MSCVDDFQTFLDEIHEETDKNELVRYRKSCDTANFHHQPAPERRRDGTRTSLGVWDVLNFLLNRLHMLIPTNLVRTSLPNNAGFLPHRMSAPPLPSVFWLIWRISLPPQTALQSLRI